MNSKNKSFVEADVTTWSETDYRRLLDEIEPIFLAEEGSPASERADVLFERIEAYEQHCYHKDEWMHEKKAEVSAKRQKIKTRDLITLQ